MRPGVPYDSSSPKLKTCCGPLYIHIVTDKNKQPIKVLFQLGKAGGCVPAHFSVLSEYLNQAFKDNTIVSALSKLTGIKCWEGDSCISIAARYLLNYVMTAREEVNE